MKDQVVGGVPVSSLSQNIKLDPRPKVSKISVQPHAHSHIFQTRSAIKLNLEVQQWLTANPTVTILGLSSWSTGLNFYCHCLWKPQ